MRHIINLTLRKLVVLQVTTVILAQALVEGRVRAAVHATTSDSAGPQLPVPQSLIFSGPSDDLPPSSHPNYIYRYHKTPDQLPQRPLC